MKFHWMQFHWTYEQEIFGKLIYYFFNDMNNIKDFDSSLLKIDKKIIQKHWCLQHWIHYKKMMIMKVLII